MDIHFLPERGHTSSFKIFLNRTEFLYQGRYPVRLIRDASSTDRSRYYLCVKPSDNAWYGATKPYTLKWWKILIRRASNGENIKL